MRIKHISDTHGRIEKLYGRFDIIVHSGDFLPTFPYIFENNLQEEMQAQLFWLKSVIPKLQEQIKEKLFLFVPGNHDILPADTITNIMQLSGINAVNISEKLYSHNGINFYGFPYIPYIHGRWNYECFPPTMLKKVDEMLQVINSTYTDIIAAHSAIYNYLDIGEDEFGIRNNFGSTALANMFDYKLNKDMIPRAFLHGHIHESHGMTNKNDMIISNAAKIQNIIEV